MEKIISTFNIFNSRELATILWAIVFFIWMSGKPHFLSSLLNIFKALIKIWPIFLAMVIYVILSILLLYKFSFWHQALMKITIFWFCGWAFIMVMNIDKIASNKNFLKKTLINILGFTVFISFITNFYTFPFFIEIFLVPVAILITAMAAFSEMYKEYYLVHKVMNGVMITLGAVVIFTNLLRVTSNLQEFATTKTLQEFLLPILLSLIFLPFMYFLSAYLKYQSKRAMDKFMEEKDAAG